VIRTDFHRGGVRRIFCALVVPSTGACGGNGTEPTGTTDPGFVRVAVTGPLSPDVAFKFRITGTQVDSVRAATGTMYFEELGPGLHRVIVVDVADRDRLVEFWVPDRNGLAEYGVNLEEVAATGTYENLSVAGYVISLGQ